MFWILVATIPLIGIVPLVVWRVSTCDKDVHDALSLIPTLPLLLLPIVLIAVVWDDHASDLSRVNAQEHRIEVQQQRIVNLTERLDAFNYPAKAGISLDADYPWAAIVESLTDAENRLAEALDERAIAIRSIEARKRGPMSGIVTLVGER